MSSYFKILAFVSSFLGWDETRLLRNSKSEILNSKQYRNSNVQNTKQSKGQLLRAKTSSFRALGFWLLGFVSARPGASWHGFRDIMLKNPKNGWNNLIHWIQVWARDFDIRISYFLTDMVFRRFARLPLWQDTGREGNASLEGGRFLVKSLC